ncbi:MAG: ATP-binding protein [Pseudomonadota bacterium]
MNRLFYRFFLLVMLSISVATFLIYIAIRALFGDPLEDIARRQASAQIFLIEQYVDQAPADEWLGRLNKVREVSKTSLELITIDAAKAALPAREAAALMRGELILDAPNKAFYRRVDLTGEKYIGSEAEVIHVHKLPIDLGLALEMEALRYVIVAIALLIPIALWSRSHWHGLQSLSRVADEFGAGKLSARARLKPNASIYPLAERINHMAGRIEGLLDSQRTLLHSVSHELRTPIARLEFALELLRGAADDPALEKRIGAMAGDLAELNALVGELLGMAKLDSAQTPARAPFALGPALQACVDGLPAAGPPTSVALGAGLGEFAGDQRLLVRAVDNLLRNAGKYAQQAVALSATRAPGAPDVVTIMVEDDGPGIPEAERARVFEPFYRLDRSRDRASGGFGLGLSIASKAVLLHGGTLRVGQSRLGGACFVITLPCA